MLAIFASHLTYHLTNSYFGMFSLLSTIFVAEGYFPSFLVLIFGSCNYSTGMENKMVMIPNMICKLSWIFHQLAHHNIFEYDTINRITLYYTI